jgi:hypothetical protein
MGDKKKHQRYVSKQSGVELQKPYDRKAANAAMRQAADERGGLGPDEDLLALPKGMDPPGHGFQKIPSRNPDFDIYYRRRGPGGGEGSGTDAGQGEQGAEPQEGGIPGSEGTSPESTTPGSAEVSDVEKNFSGDKDPDGLCEKCIARGLSRGAAIAATVGLILTILSCLIPEVWVARITGVLLGLAIKGFIDLIRNSGNMSSQERQEAWAEFAGGLIVGFAGPKPGPLGPKGGFKSPVAVTPEGVPMPVPEAVPVAEPAVPPRVVGAGAAAAPIAMTRPKKTGREGGEPKKKAKERREEERRQRAQERGGEDEDEGTPRNNRDQNRMFDEIARGLNEEQRRRLHDEITGQNLTREELIGQRNAMFPDNPYPGS